LKPLNAGQFVLSMLVKEDKHHMSIDISCLSGSPLDNLDLLSFPTRRSSDLRQVAHVLLTRPPLVPQLLAPKGDQLLHALDLHVLGTPPAFVLSQDQTLQ